jgi:hypothetical protein
MKPIIQWERYPKLRAIFEHRPRTNQYWLELDALLHVFYEAGRQERGDKNE